MEIDWSFIAYLTLVIYAANGMFDSIAFFFALIAVTMFLRDTMTDSFCLWEFHLL